MPRHYINRLQGCYNSVAMSAPSETESQFCEKTPGKQLLFFRKVPPCPRFPKISQSTFGSSHIWLANESVPAFCFVQPRLVPILADEDRGEMLEAPGSIPRTIYRIHSILQKLSPTQLRNILQKFLENQFLIQFSIQFHSIPLNSSAFSMKKMG